MRLGRAKICCSGTSKIGPVEAELYACVRSSFIFKIGKTYPKGT